MKRKTSRRRGKSRRLAGSRRRGPRKPAGSEHWGARIRIGFENLLHTNEERERPWKWLPLLLGLAFVCRAAVALSGDFVLHPDEIMQYLEPAHRLAFGNGVVYWEYHYGVRSWWVPGAVAAVLKAFDAVGLGQPGWYVGGVKLMFCGVSLAIPAGMYFFARRHFSESSARVALIAGAFWYELAGFAHKPLTEFVATAPLMILLGFLAGPKLENGRSIWAVAILAVLAAAVRFQYAPLALGLLGIAFWITDRKLQLTIAVALLVLAVGQLDGLTWNGGWFHSYANNLRFNQIVGELRAGESPAYQFLSWLAVASGGMSVLSITAAFFSPRRYGFLLGLIALILLVHSLQTHKEYRFVFVVIPLWLLIASDLAVRVTVRVKRKRLVAGGIGLLLSVVSLAGVLNVLPFQERVYRAWSNETGAVGFIRKQDPIFSAYRYLAGEADVRGVWQVDRPYHGLPGYYYLHRRIPFYDAHTGNSFLRQGKPLASMVSHIVVEDPERRFPGYTPMREIGGIRILRRDHNERPVQEWTEYVPTRVFTLEEEIMRRVDPKASPPPPNAGIHFLDEELPPPITR